MPDVTSRPRWGFVRRTLACLLGIPGTIAVVAGVVVMVDVQRNPSVGPPPNDAGGMVFMSAVLVTLMGLVLLVLAYIAWPPKQRE